MRQYNKLNDKEKIANFILQTIGKEKDTCEKKANRMRDLNPKKPIRIRRNQLEYNERANCCRLWSGNSENLSRNGKLGDKLSFPPNANVPILVDSASSRSRIRNM